MTKRQVGPEKVSGSGWIVADMDTVVQAFLDRVGSERDLKIIGYRFWIDGNKNEIVIQIDTDETPRHRIAKQ